MIGIYGIKNKANGKIYIGQTVDVDKRWAQHKSDLRAGRHDNKRLQADWIKYGEGAFEMFVVEGCDEQSLYEKEIKWVAKYDSFKNGYNMTEGGAGARGAGVWLAGREYSAETRKKISDSAKKRVGERNAFFGKKHNERTKEKIRAAREIPVVDLTAGVVYRSAKAADYALGGKSSNVTKCLKGQSKTAYGHRWAYSINGV